MPAPGALAPFEPPRAQLVAAPRIAVDGVGVRRALPQRAVRPAEAVVAPTPKLFLGVPVLRVGGPDHRARPRLREDRVLGRVVRVRVGRLRDVQLRQAHAVPGAVVRAHGPLTRGAGVVLEAFALARLAVADAGVRALLLLLVRSVLAPDLVGPRDPARARAPRAVGARPREVARAVVVGPAVPGGLRGRRVLAAVLGVALARVLRLGPGHALGGLEERGGAARALAVAWIRKVFVCCKRTVAYWPMDTLDRPVLIGKKMMSILSHCKLRSQITRTGAPVRADRNRGADHDGEDDEQYHVYASPNPITSLEGLELVASNVIVEPES